VETPKVGQKWTAIKWRETFVVEAVTFTHVVGTFTMSHAGLEWKGSSIPLSYFMLRYRRMTKLEEYLNE
jgi:hypothetical protein